MTIHVDYLQAGTYTAADDRYAEGTGLVSSGGVTWRTGVLLGDGTELKVSAQVTPNMTVKIAPGQGAVPCSGDATSAPYMATNDAVTNVTIATSDPTNPRKDLIVLTVRDSFYSGVNNDGILQVITGVPNATPSLPATPTNSIALAEVDVAANATSIGAGNIIDLRTYTAGRGGILVCTSTTRPTSAYAGMPIYETDTGYVQVYNGTVWKALPKPGPKGLIAKVLASGVADITTGSGTVTVATVSPTLENGRTYKVTYNYNGTIVSNTAQVVVKALSAGAEITSRPHSATALEGIGGITSGSSIYTIVGTGAAVALALTVVVITGTGAARTLSGTAIFVEDMDV